MTHTKRTQLSAFASLAFGQGRPDAFSMPDEPRIASSICGITSLFGVRGPLFDEDKGAGGGGEKTFKQEDVDRIVQERVGKMKTQLDAATEALKELDAIKTKLADADKERQDALDAKELEGKSAEDKLKIQLTKASDLLKAKEAEWAKKHSDAEALAKQHETRFVDHVKRSAVTDALVASGVLGSAVGDAAQSFLGEAQLELDEKHGIKSLVVGGKTFEKPADAAKHFLSTKPYYASAPSGGSGNPRLSGGGAPSAGDVSKTSADDDFAVGMSKN
jgi:hypothetical protein